MKRNTKKTLLIGSTSLLAVVLGVAVVNHTAANGGLFAYRTKAANYDGLSVTFDANSEVLSGSIQSTSCLLGSRLQVSGIRVKASIFNSSVPMSEGVISRFNGDSATVDFIVGDSNESPATNFQSLTSISFGYKEGSTSGKFKVMWSNDNSYWNIISVDSGIASQSLPLGAHYVRVVNDGGYAQFTSFTLNYSCSDTPVSHVHEIEYFGFDEQELEGIYPESLEYSAEAGQHVVIEPVYMPAYAFYYAQEITDYITDFEVENGVIEFTMPDHDISLEIAVESLAIELESIAVSNNTKTSFTVGDVFDFDGTVIATYTDLSEFDVTEDVEFSGYDMDEAGEQTVTVSYTDGGITKTDTYNIVVSSGSQSVALEGTYNYTSRKDHTSDTNWTGMSLTFTDDGKCTWRNIRTAKEGFPQETVTYDSKIFFDYEAIDNGANITITLTVCSGKTADKIDFEKTTSSGTTSSDSISYWTGTGGYDRPVCGGLLTDGIANDSCVMSINKGSLTIDVYRYVSADKTYEQYDTFTFTLAA